MAHGHDARSPSWWPLAVAVGALLVAIAAVVRLQAIESFGDAVAAGLLVGLVAVLAVSRARAQTEIGRATADLRGAEAEARRQASFLTAVLESVADGVVVVDETGAFVMHNHAAREILGIDLDTDPDDPWRRRFAMFEADGRTPLPPDSTPLARALDGESTDLIEMVIRNSTRPEPITISASGRPLTAEGGVSGAVAVFSDITAREAFAHALADREQLLAGVLETSADPFVATDAVGVVIMWNPAAEALFGWTADDAVGRRLADLLVPERLRAAHQEGLHRRVTTGEVRLTSDPVQLPALREDGTEVLIEMTLGEMAWQGERRFHAFLRDVSEREAARASLARSEERLRGANVALAAANTELDRFTATVAHDLKNPLTAISGYAELLYELRPERPREEGQAIAAIQRASDNMRVMIDDLLGFARAANEPLHLEPVDTGRMVDELADEMRASASGIVAMTRGALPALCAHPTLLRQLLANLLGNAVKYVAPGIAPRVHVAARRDADGDGPWTVTVADNGIGIADEARDRVFAMFHRETNTGYAGTGIGLTTCRRIVERHGGRIWVEDGPAGGSTFCFALPPPDGDVAVPVAEASPGITSRG